MPGETTKPRLIANTAEPMRHPWPTDALVQGGARGLVLNRNGNHYRTAFVEVSQVTRSFAGRVRPSPMPRMRRGSSTHT